MVNRVQASWDNYADRVLPPNLSRTERENFRAMYFAGAYTMFHFLMPGVKLLVSVLEKDGQQKHADMFHDLETEFDAFFSRHEPEPDQENAFSPGGSEHD